MSRDQLLVREKLRGEASSASQYSAIILSITTTSITVTGKQHDDLRCPMDCSDIVTR